MRFFYCKASDVHERVVDGKVLLYKSGSKCVYELNESASFLWNNLSKNTTSSKLVELLRNFYEVSLSDANRDVSEFLNFYLLKKIVSRRWSFTQTM